jgi:hypothetical protein
MFKAYETFDGTVSMNKYKKTIQEYMNHTCMINIKWVN